MTKSKSNKTISNPSKLSKVGKGTGIRLNEVDLSQIWGGNLYDQFLGPPVKHVPQ